MALKDETTQDTSLANALSAFIARMTGQQKLRFKQAVVEQALWYAEQRLPPIAQDEGERACLQVARRWLDEPTSENAQRAADFAAADSTGGGVRHHNYAELFLEPVWAAGAQTPEQAAFYATKAATDTAFELRLRQYKRPDRAAYEMAWAAGRQAADEAWEWQIEAAQAILRGEEPPLLDPDEDV
jgi:hypothetical protein